MPDAARLPGAARGVPGAYDWGHAADVSDQEFRDAAVRLVCLMPLDTIDLTTGEKMVYMALAAHIDYELICWPSIKRLMVLCGMSRWGVKKALVSLEAKGWLVMKRYIPTAGVPRGTNGYLLQGEWATQLPYRTARMGNSVAAMGNSVAPNINKKIKSHGQEVFDRRFSTNGRAKPETASALWRPPGAEAERGRD